MERLMELHFRYLDKVTESDRSVQRDKLGEDEAYLRWLDSGLFSLQLVDHWFAPVAQGRLTRGWPRSSTATPTGRP